MTKIPGIPHPRVVRALEPPLDQHFKTLGRGESATLAGGEEAQRPDGVQRRQQVALTRLSASWSSWRIDWMRSRSRTPPYARQRARASSTSLGWPADHGYRHATHVDRHSPTQPASTRSTGIPVARWTKGRSGGATSPIING